MVGRRALYINKLDSISKHDIVPAYNFIHMLEADMLVASQNYMTDTNSTAMLKAVQNPDHVEMSQAMWGISDLNINEFLALCVNFCLTHAITDEPGFYTYTSSSEEVFEEIANRLPKGVDRSAAYTLLARAHCAFVRLATLKLSTQPFFQKLKDDIAGLPQPLRSLIEERARIGYIIPELVLVAFKTQLNIQLLFLADLLPEPEFQEYLETVNRFTRISDDFYHGVPENIN